MSAARRSTADRPIPDRSHLPARSRPTTMARMPHQTSQIRNVALVGHGGVGKTTIAEALLFAAGVTSRPGRVDDGTSVLDREPEEIDRRSTVSLALASF